MRAVPTKLSLVGRGRGAEATEVGVVDAEGCAYTYGQVFNDLFLLEGLRF